MDENVRFQGIITYVFRVYKHTLFDSQTVLGKSSTFFDNLRQLPFAACGTFAPEDETIPEQSLRNDQSINQLKQLETMSKAYRVTPYLIQIGDRKGETVYNVTPVNYGTLTSDDVARQIAAESTASPGDVKAVLDRYAYYVVENLKKGYAIELLGFGKLYLRFLTGKSVTDEKKATANLVKSLIPAFRPSFTIVNGARIYDLVPDKIQLVKYQTGMTAENAPTTDGSTDSGNTDTDTDSGSTDNGGEDSNPL